MAAGPHLGAICRPGAGPRPTAACSAAAPRTDPRCRRPAAAAVPGRNVGIHWLEATLVSARYVRIDWVGGGFFTLVFSLLDFDGDQVGTGSEDQSVRFDTA